MLLRVLHETVYEYSPAVTNAQHMAHLRPLDLPRQQLLQHALCIDPEPSQCVQLDDVFGNART
ncbi:MAG: transglutaminase N-terminal domain-containing protein, partial [Burkholderiaceae bacterium]